MDGIHITPNRCLYDSEFVLASYGNGHPAYCEKANLSLNLEYLNGKIYKPIPHSYNFGCDTAEFITNIHDIKGYITNGTEIYTKTNYLPIIMNVSFITGLIFYIAIEKKLYGKNRKKGIKNSTKRICL